MSTWSHDDMFPIISRIISQVYKTQQDFVSHEEIVAHLMQEPTAKHQIERAQQEQAGRSEQQIASNMVAWFSQRMSDQRLPNQYRDTFERVKRNRNWAYRPKVSQE